MLSDPLSEEDMANMNKRELANYNERRRMQTINSGFDSLKALLPGVLAREKMSKAVTLQRVAEYVRTLQQTNEALETENTSLKRKLSALGHDDEPIQRTKRRRLYIDASGRAHNFSAAFGARGASRPPSQPGSPAAAPPRRLSEPSPASSPSGSEYTSPRPSPSYTTAAAAEGNLDIMFAAIAKIESEARAKELQQQQQQEQPQPQQQPAPPQQQPQAAGMAPAWTTNGLIPRRLYVA